MVYHGKILRRGRKIKPKKMKSKKDPRDLVFNIIKKSKEGMTITDITKGLSISRSAVRTALAFLEGQEKVIYRNIGMAKVYIC